MKRKRNGKREALKDFKCKHCGKLFQELHYLTIEYCSNKCSYIYNPIPTAPIKPVTTKLAKATERLRKVRIEELRDIQGIHNYEVIKGVEETLTDAETAEIKKDLRESYLNGVNERKMITKHLTDSDIDRIVDDLFSFMQSFMFFKPSKDIDDETR